MNGRRREDYTAANREAWDASAPLHGQGAAWEALLAAAAQPGFSVLDEHLTGIVGGLGLDGGSAVQICCNNARELLSLASLGLRPALGIDISAGFLDQGRKLAEAAGLSPRLVASDVYSLPQDLGRHDLALITIGALGWMPELAAFFRVVAGLIAPGGALVVYETHPVLEMFDPAGVDPHAPATSYFERRPFEVPELITYDGTDHGPGKTGYWFVHTLGDVVTACAATGLRVERLTEYPHTIREPEYDIYAGREAQVPMSFSLVARMPEGVD
ncbi:class I SAM-dependent methyltransferase [Chachezhania sediminis]|uniref:class I SAM-dependent methyltransferase n=1 Tax=Chachezhania sediminis TaxID=2599291 RepID=UPI00131C2C34|nr:class I SAM-dependent methyltransferase [Chachezhania sediminis]